MNECLDNYGAHIPYDLEDCVRITEIVDKVKIDHVNGEAEMHCIEETKHYDLIEADHNERGPWVEIRLQHDRYMDDDSHKASSIKHLSDILRSIGRPAEW